MCIDSKVEKLRLSTLKFIDFSIEDIATGKTLTHQLIIRYLIEVSNLNTNKKVYRVLNKT